MTKCTVFVAEREDGRPGMDLVVVPKGGKEFRLSMPPDEGMSLADRATMVCERHMQEIWR